MMCLRNWSVEWELVTVNLNLQENLTSRSGPLIEDIYSGGILGAADYPPYGGVGMTIRTGRRSYTHRCNQLTFNIVLGINKQLNLRNSSS
ncbi:hypothetical protein TWF225_004279 [Orbilia oligospora]|uniref:Uncharacterized protein n=1 Tax=Orbilia oligospora TaxID=2813651 RepID=A0A7C8P721_ORBOL|nr:hypothetical protein TWF225_004279 [Orbilia oligospora]KAF3162260.1 hypothetical protein TWF751_010840 [Orbilia oligospora]KAF3241695.1 hypothetical protein TWF128_010701 [Orbilia oligospora]KAF3249797.1 hypothetical protein TWF217_008707 [Orbilia oligospora]KAF3292554.1 hypothetical protein TWF132_005604 [Orbilia oligospora]